MATSDAQSARRSRWPAYRLALQVMIAITIILCWELLPRIDWLADRYKFLNPFYISSPGDVADWVWRLATGSGQSNLLLWPYLWNTVKATVVGVAIGLSLGAIAGLVCSNSRRLAEVVRPFVVLANSIPRVAIIPIFVVIVGPTVQASIVSVVAVVFFLGFFNAFEGGSSIPQPMLDNARLLGGGSVSIMRRIRLPRVLSWTFATVPNAISFGLVVAVTTELLAGIKGMGQLLQNSLVNVNSSLTFAVIVLLMVVGLAMHGLSLLLRNYLLRWDAD